MSIRPFRCTYVGGKASATFGVGAGAGVFKTPEGQETYTGETGISLNASRVKARTAAPVWCLRLSRAVRE